MKPEPNTSAPSPIVLNIEQLILNNGTEKRQVRNKITEITGITRQALVKWFSGDTTYPALQHLILISDFYNTTIDALAKEALASTPPATYTIADRLYLAMELAGYRDDKIKQKMSELCDISFLAVTRWYRSTTPKAVHIAIISKHCAVDLHWLITGDKE